MDEITGKQHIWCGHVERMDRTRLPKIMISCKPEGRKKRGRPRRTWKDGIHTAMGERELRVGEWNSRRQWNVEFGRRRQAFYNRAIYICMFIYIYIYIYHAIFRITSFRITGVLYICIYRTTNPDAGYPARQISGSAWPFQ